MPRISLGAGAKMQFLVKPLLRVSIVCIAASGSIVQAGDTYYVKPDGDDNASGLTPETAWRSADQVNSTIFSPGSQILFERGGEWRERLVASSSGTAQNPIVYGAYGTGSKPKFWGSDLLANSAFTKVDGTTSTYRRTRRHAGKRVPGGP